MRDHLLAASLALALLAGCSGASTGGGVAPAAETQRLAPDAVASNAVANPGFESGSLSSWSGCGSVAKQSVSSAQAHTGSYSALVGTTSKPEVNGSAALCQTVTVPTGGTLSFWVYEGTNDTISYVDQEADVYDTSGNLLKQLYKEAKSTGGWVQKSFSLSSYAGETVQLSFGVKGNGYASDYVYAYLDDVTLTGSSSASSSPTTAPTTAPTASASGTPFACNDTKFTNDQNAFAAGTISADQPEDVCGVVTQVLAAKKTTSGNHGYFYVQLPSGYQIEIVSNLDAMAQASTDRPPTTWPWVAVNQYVYVRGRYYYDSSSSQGIDWTEDDTSSSWSQLGYVAVCTSSGTSCQKYW